MPWQNNLDDDAQRNFAADERNQTGAQPDPALTQQPCPPCPVRLVVVEFAEKPSSRTSFFMGARYQYVNLSSAALVGVDPAITSAHQLGQTPPIVVKVTPPQAKTVTLRLVRAEGSHGFPAGSATLSARENGLAHLTWPVATSSVTTDGNGDGKSDGIQVSALAGFKYHVEGSIDGGPFMRSSNSVNIRRRLAIRKVVRHAAGQAVATAAINSIQSDLDLMDIEAFQPPMITGTELGVCEAGELSQSLPDIGSAALDSPDSVSVFRPHAVAIIIGEFIPSSRDPITPQTFGVTVNRDAGGRFPASTPLPLSLAGRTHIVVPLTSGRQWQGGSVTPGTGSAVPLAPADVTGMDTFSRSVTINLSRFQTLPASITTLTVSVTLKAITGWAVGWAYHAQPVIYLNMRSPGTNAILTAEKAAALAIHELGHKLHLTSDQSGNLPDQPQHHYPSFNTARRKHTGPHCSTGVPPDLELDSDDAHNAATCTMWGALKTTRLFCSECKTTLRKVDLSSGF